MRMPKSKSTLVVAVLLLGLAVVAWYLLEGREPPSHLISLDSRSLASLKDDFNRAAGGARLIVLLSPT
jgi:hypothetical protein